MEKRELEGPLFQTMFQELGNRNPRGMEVNPSFKHGQLR